MDMYNNNQLVRARLKEEVLDVAEENIDLTATVVRIAQTVLVDFYLPSNTLTIESRAYENVIKIYGLAA